MDMEKTWTSTLPHWWNWPKSGLRLKPINKWLFFCGRRAPGCRGGAVALPPRRERVEGVTPVKANEPAKKRTAAALSEQLSSLCPPRPLRARCLFPQQSAVHGAANLAKMMGSLLEQAHGNFCARWHCLSPGVCRGVQPGSARRPFAKAMLEQRKDLMTDACAAGWRSTA